VAVHFKLAAARALRLKGGGSMRCYQVLILSLPLTIGGCAVSATPMASPSLPALPKPAVYTPPPPPKPTVHEVTASWYGNEFAGRPTTSGESFDPRRLTAASISLPLGSVVKVENPKNGRSVKVRINDCGPFVRGRSLDLSLRAAQKIDIVHQGVAHVKITTVKTPPDADVDRCNR
jgi:rare lipoprotein A